MVGSKPIANFDFYNSEMSKSMIDKIFFMDKIDDSIRVINLVHKEDFINHTLGHF